MPSSLALILTVAFIIFLFARDSREKPNVTGALWIPLIWMSIIGSRFVSQWLNLGTPLSASALEDGSPVDRMVFFGLILAGLCVLRRRRARVSEIVRSNRWLAFFLLYCLIAVMWSEFPFVAFKRWIKILGHPIMALVLVTEPDPVEAVTRLMKRCAYLLVPLSILFIKYFPELGRGFSEWTGAAYNTGVTTNKNELGYVCMVLGLFFAWNLLKTWRAEKSVARRNELLLSFGFLAMIWWLLRMAESATALMSLLLGVATVAVVGLRCINPKWIGTYLLAAILLASTAEMTFGVYANTIELMGRDSTLTDRTKVWKELLEFEINPVLGAGFESFWLGARLDELWSRYWWRPNQAHNGYLETYLNLGWIGVFVLAGLIFATFGKVRGELVRGSEYARLRLGFLLAILAYNYTEAAFKGVHLVWFVFYIIALDYPRFRHAASASVAGAETPQQSQWRDAWLSPAPSNTEPTLNGSAI